MGWTVWVCNFGRGKRFFPTLTQEPTFLIENGETSLAGKVARL
jgi:hypothetical protein